LDKTLLDHTVALAEKTGGSVPGNCVRSWTYSLVGAGRVEDTLNCSAMPCARP